MSIPSSPGSTPTFPESTPAPSSSQTPHPGILKKKTPKGVTPKNPETEAKVTKIHFAEQNTFYDPPESPTGSPEHTPPGSPEIPRATVLPGKENLRINPQTGEVMTHRRGISQLPSRRGDPHPSIPDQELASEKSLLINTFMNQISTNETIQKLLKEVNVALTHSKSHLRLVKEAAQKVYYPTSKKDKEENKKNTNELTRLLHEFEGYSDKETQKKPYIFTLLKSKLDTLITTLNKEMNKIKVTKHVEKDSADHQDKYSDMEFKISNETKVEELDPYKALLSETAKLKEDFDEFIVNPKMTNLP